MKNAVRNAFENARNAGIQLIAALDDENADSNEIIETLQELASSLQYHFELTALCDDDYEIPADELTALCDYDYEIPADELQWKTSEKLSKKGEL